MRNQETSPQFEWLKWPPHHDILAEDACEVQVSRLSTHSPVVVPDLTSLELGRTKGKVTRRKKNYGRYGAPPAWSRAHVDVYARVKSSGTPCLPRPPSTQLHPASSFLFHLPGKHISPSSSSSWNACTCACVDPPKSPSHLSFIAAVHV